MAKLGGDPDSATSQWFFNLANNSANLDFQNGGFTVFARVVGSGMNVVDAMAALDRVNAGGAFTDLPVLDLDVVIAQQDVFNTDAVVINDVTLLNLPDGDYDFDGDGDGVDFLVWQRSLGSTTEAEADGNGNGIVDGADLVFWEGTYGLDLSPLSASAAVPEPTTSALALAALCLAMSRRRIAAR